MSLLTYQLLHVLIICYISTNLNPAKCELNDDDSFLYYAYGSNLLAKRIQYSNPSAEFYDIGELENYRLDFSEYSIRWGGAGATIVPTANSSVWGAIWKISNEHLTTLDRQEGVDIGRYFGLYIDVRNVHGKLHRCRVYRQTEEIKKPVPLSALPEDRRPSMIYLNTMIKGAEECGLPKYYIDSLMSVKHNGQESPTIEVAEMGL